MKRLRPTGVGVFFGSLLVAVLLSGCSAQTASVSDPAPSTEASPEFSGPWADEFAWAYEEARSDFARAALLDERVTDSELAEVRTRFADCLGALGYSEVSFEPNGAFSVRPPRGMDEQTDDDNVTTCSDLSGESTVGAMHSWTRRNPENLDDDTIIVACLIREGAVAPSYTPEQFAADESAASIPYAEGFGESDFIACNADPLGLFR